MKRTEINKRFTQEVVSYIAMGYTIHTESMSGSQGETAKVDLENGTDRIRIYLEDHDTDYDLGYNVTTLVVGRVPEDEWNRTVWNNHLDVFYTEKWYQIGRNGYFVNRKEAVAASNKRSKRWEARRSYRHSENRIDLYKYAPSVESFVRRQKGCKRIRWSEIDKVYKVMKNGKWNYYVEAKNHTFKLA